MKTYKNIGCKFTKVSNNPVVIGFLGDVSARELPKEQIGYVKAFYGISGRKHKIVKSYPVLNSSYYNDFMVIE